MKVNFDRTSKTGKVNQPINQGDAYTILSWAKSHAKLQLLNFYCKHIKVNPIGANPTKWSQNTLKTHSNNSSTNIAALNEMGKMREHAVFTWKHPIADSPGNKIVLFNLRSWNAQIEQFITDTEITEHCHIMCFTETCTYGNNFANISNYLNGWEYWHICTEYGLAFCFKEQSLKVLE